MAPQRLLVDSAVFERPITPAALPPRTAFGVLASVAAMLRALASGAERWERWRPDSGTDLTSVASFVAWLAPGTRWLFAQLASGWDHRAGEALRATIDWKENAG